MSINYRNYKEYENFIKLFHENILEKDGFKDIKVQHNVKIQGKSTATHQIDVFWKHLLEDGNELKVCIECKNWNAKVEQGDLLKFKGVLDDIGEAKGIFVTKNGFQIGAKKIAESYGIELICATVDEEDYNSRLEFSINNFNNFNFVFENCEGERRKKIDKWISRKQKNIVNNPFIYNSQKNKISDFVSLISNIKNEHDEFETKKYMFNLLDSYIKVKGELYAITGVEYEYERIHDPNLDLHAAGKIAKIVADYIFNNRQEIFYLYKG